MTSLRSMSRFAQINNFFIGKKNYSALRIYSVLFFKLNEYDKKLEIGWVQVG